jgi:hypothetical protein
MGFKDILVTIDTGPTARGRIELAAALAKRFSAHLIGLHTSLSTSLSPDAPQTQCYFEYFNRSLVSFQEELAERTRADAAATRLLFEEITARHSLSSEWRQGSGYPSQAAELHGRYADLNTKHAWRGMPRKLSTGSLRRRKPKASHARPFITRMSNPTKQSSRLLPQAVVILLLWPHTGAAVSPLLYSVAKRSRYSPTPKSQCSYIAELQG